MIQFTSDEFLKLIPKYVLDIAEALQKNNYEAFLVGGSIRDILMGLKPDDYDIATNAYPEEVSRIFEKSIPTGAKFGTITVIVQDEFGENHDIEVTTYRSEADYVGGRWPSKVEFTKTIQEDLARRDFTINSIALNLQNFDSKINDFSSQLVDPYNGIKDLQNKILRAVRDPIERFTEDGLRPVRGCRLASQLVFKIEDNTFEAMKQTNHITKMVSVERFRDELLKILLKSPKPSVGIDLLRQSGILKLFIPELLEGIDITQPEFHADDVYTHSLKTCDIAEDSIKLAALFHDIGKPYTKTQGEKGIHFYGHDVKGAELTREIMKRLRFSNIEIERTCSLVRWHMFYYPSSEWRSGDAKDDYKTKHGWTDGAIRRLINSVGGEDAIDDLLKLRIADQKANPKYEFNQEELNALAERIADIRSKDMALKINDLAIKGQDLINEFKLEPGPQIRKTLEYLLELVIDDPMLNKKETLVGLAREYLK